MALPARSPLLDVHRSGDRTVVRFRGCDSLDEYNSEAVGRQLARLAEGQPRPHLVLDLSGIRDVTSTALGQFIALNRQAHAAGGRLALANAGPAVREALAITRLDQVLDVQAAEAHEPPA